MSEENPIKEVLLFVLSNPMDGKIYVSPGKEIIENLKNTQEDYINKWNVLEFVIEKCRLALPIISIYDYILYYIEYVINDEQEKERRKQFIEKMAKNPQEISADELQEFIETIYNSYLLLHSIINLEDENQIKGQLINVYKHLIIMKNIVKLDFAQRLSFFLNRYKVSEKVNFTDFVKYMLENLDKYIAVDNFKQTIKKDFKDNKGLITKIIYVPLSYNLFLRINTAIKDFLVLKKLIKKSD